MANTSNFGWETPDDTDLVKDGALAIRTVAGAIDTSLGQITLNAQTGTTYTFVLADNRNKIVTGDNASPITFSIPTNASVAFPIGSVINVVQIGVGQITINAVTSGTTTIASTGATSTAPKLRARYSAAACVKVATDVWYVIGDLA
jgi:hypothetical protein